MLSTSLFRRLAFIMSVFFVASLGAWGQTSSAMEHPSKLSLASNAAATGVVVVITMLLLVATFMLLKEVRKLAETYRKLYPEQEQQRMKVLTMSLSQAGFDEVRRPGIDESLICFEHRC